MAGSAESSALQTREIEELAPSDGCINNDDVNPLSTELDLRRHSSQDDRPCEIFERQILNHMYRQSPSPSTIATNFVPIEKIHSNNRLFNRNALNWLKNFNLMRLNAPACETSPLMQQLQRCVSENTLLLSSEHRTYDLSGTSAIRKSFSSGILFWSVQPSSGRLRIASATRNYNKFYYYLFRIKTVSMSQWSIG